MISFEGTEFTLITMDFQAYAEAFNNRFRREMKEAAKRFYKAAISKIPSPFGPVKSERATGFSSGALKNILDAIKRQRGQGLHFEDLVDANVIDAERRLNSYKGLSKLYFDYLKKQIKEMDKESSILNTSRSRKPIPFDKRVKNNAKFGPRTREVLRKRRPELYQGRIVKTPQSGRQFATPVDEILTSSGGPRSSSPTLTFKFFLNIDYFQLEDVHGRRSPTAPWRSMKLGKSAFMLYVRSSAFAEKVFPKVSDYFLKTTIRITDKGLTRVRVTRRKLEENG